MYTLNNSTHNVQIFTLNGVQISKNRFEVEFTTIKKKKTKNRKKKKTRSKNRFSNCKNKNFCSNNMSVLDQFSNNLNYNRGRHRRKIDFPSYIKFDILWHLSGWKANEIGTKWNDIERIVRFWSEKMACDWHQNGFVDCIMVVDLKIKCHGTRQLRKMLPLQFREKKENFLNSIV